MEKQIGIPTKPPHIFTRVAFDFVPEVSYDDLMILSQLVTHAKREDFYVSLIDCLVKMQWAKFAGLEAISIEEFIINAFEEGDFLIDLTGKHNIQRRCLILFLMVRPH